MKKSKIIINEYGDKYWILNDKLHRIDGPAIEYSNGEKRWHINGKLHRIDGPAIEYADGTKKWFLNDKEVKEEDVIDINPNITEKEYINFVINL